MLGWNCCSGGTTQGCGPGGSSQERSGEARNFTVEPNLGSMKSGKCCLKKSRLNQTTFPAIFLIELSIVEVWVEMKALI